MPEVKEYFTRLNELPRDVVAEVDARLQAGESPMRVARWLQGKMGVFKDLKADSLKRNLARYRDNTLNPRVMNQMVTTAKGAKSPATKKRLIAMDEMEDLIAVQMRRWQKVVTQEEKMPLTLKQATDEGRLLKEMLVELGKMQLETGVGMQKAPRRITGRVMDPSGEVKEFSWTEEQDQLFRSLNIDGDFEVLEDASVDQSEEQVEHASA